MVSILLPAYNAQKYLRKSIESILSQTCKDFELILIDDGSTDDTLNIMQEYANKDKRIIIDSHANIGMGESLNKALKSTIFDLIIRMDADDIMHDNRIEKQLNFMKNNTDITVASCLAYYINENNRKIGRTFSDLKSINDAKKYYKNNDPIGILHPGVIFRKKDIMDIGGYRSQFWPAEDIDLWNRLLENGKNIVVMQEFLMRYRIHGDSIITSKFKQSRLKFEWVRECMWFRRAGKDEITLKEFLQMQKNLPLSTKINKFRKNHAKLFYRNSGFDYASNKLFRFLYKLLLAFILQPPYVIKKLIKQKK
jgi:glycosyltransferase involved in cell wall biosynthesis